MRPAIPTFAVVGAVNHGKSSAVAALLEDDTIRVSAMPGETVDNQRFALADLLVLYDTPGFQNARKTLAEIVADEDVDAPLAPFRRFVERHRDDPAFDAECRLLAPIVDGAGIVYVVDGSRPLHDLHAAEMEILRRTGAPRLAIVNRSGVDEHVDAWKGRLDQHFNIVRTFDAHRVTHRDRVDLVEALASIERAWKEPLLRVARLFEADRERRIADTAALIADLLVYGLGHVERARIAPSSDAATRDAEAAALKGRYVDAIVAKERAVHRRIIALHAHRHVAHDPDLVVDGDLFSERTWRLFGLATRQLVGVSGVAGGIAGAGIDAATLGHSLGIGAALGAATGAGGAWLMGRRRPDLSIDWPVASLPRFARMALGGKGLRVGGGDLVVGPYAAANFPWILIDRALCLFACVDTRSHARRDAEVASVGVLLPILQHAQLTVADWSDVERAGCEPVFRAARKRQVPDAKPVARLVATLDAALKRIAAKEQKIAAALAATPVRDA